MSKAARKKKTVRKVAKRSPRERLAKMIEELNERFYERSTEILCFFVCLLAREHLLLLGLKGTAKTAIISVVTRAIKAAFFKKQLTMFSTPEELYGGIDVLALQKQGVQRHNTARMLPEAQIAAIEEIFKGNGSILNSLLTLLQSREFDNGPDVMDCPLETLVGTSNELAASVQDGMEALDDRFMVRVWTNYISDESFQDMWADGRADDFELSESITILELHDLQDQVLDVEIPDEIAEVMKKVRVALRGEPGLTLQPSDRKYVQCREIMQAHAFLDGRDEVSEDDVLFLQHVLWNEPSQRPKLAKVLAKVANPLAAISQEILDMAKERYQSLPLGENIPDEQTGEVYSKCSDAIGEFTQMRERLEREANGKRSGAVENAVAELKRMTKDVGQFAADVSGLGAILRD